MIAVAASAWGNLLSRTTIASNVKILNSNRSGLGDSELTVSIFFQLALNKIHVHTTYNDFFFLYVDC